MTFFKKMILVLTSCCLAMCSCGKTENESDAPDGVVNIEVVTEPLTDNTENDDTEDDNAEIVTTTTVFVPEYVWTTTTKKKAKPYLAAADNNYVPPVTTTSAKKPSKKTTTTAKRVPTRTTNVRPGSGGSGRPTTTKGGSGNVTATKTTIVTTTVTTTTVTTTKAPQLILLEDMTLEDKVYQMFAVSPEQLTNNEEFFTEADETLMDAFEACPVGGFIFSADNLESKEQISNMLSELQDSAKEFSGAGIFTIVQEEGGSVSPVSEKLDTYNPGSMSSLGERNDEDYTYDAGLRLGTDLKELGFNVNIAPVADLGTNYKNGLGDRVFSVYASVTADMAAKLVEGLSEAGVSPVLCHFPGIGAYDGKSAIIKRSLTQLRDNEFVPFRSGIEAGADFVLVSHHIVSGIGDNLPCDLSYKAVTEILREELEFDGIVITESHSDKAITKEYSAGEAAVMAINAGADIILEPADLNEAVEAVCDAVESGEITEERIDESVIRILNLKAEMELV